MKVLIDVLTLTLAFACGVAFMAWLSSPPASVEPAAPVLVVSEFTSEDMGKVVLVTDNVTGCQYIRGYNSSITPRMYSDGIQVCGQHTYPNGEHINENE